MGCGTLCLVLVLGCGCQGGAVSRYIHGRLCLTRQALGRWCQVLCVVHAPQVGTGPSAVWVMHSQCGACPVHVVLMLLCIPTYALECAHEAFVQK